MHSNRQPVSLAYANVRFAALVPVVAAIVVAIAPPTEAAPPPQPVSPAFTYQGVLRSSNSLYTGLADFRFELWDQDTGGFALLPAVQIVGLSVIEGRFTTEIDFGASEFNGLARWLKIEVCAPSTGGAGPWTPLTTRQRFAPTPYAVHALSIGGIQTSALAFNNPSNEFTGATLDIDSGTLHVDSPTNTVGIGIDTPGATLHVRSGSAGMDPFGASTFALEGFGNHYMSMIGTDTSETGLLFGRPSAFSPQTAAGIIYNNVATPDGLQFRTGGGNTTNMVIDQFGRVGIGTLVPDSTLTVQSFGNGLLRLIGPDGTDGAGAKLNFGFSDGAFIQEDTDNNMSIVGARLAIASPVLFGMPSVGIGTSSPGRMLQLGEPTFFGSEAMMRMVSGSGFTSRTWDVGVPSAGQGTDLAFLIDDTQFGNGPELLIAPGTGNVGIGGSGIPAARLDVSTPTTNGGDNTAVFRAPSIGPHTSHIHYGPTGDWYIRSAAATGTIVIQDSGGNVGIGTTNTSGFKLAVNGTAAKAGGGSWSVFSDARLKTNIRELPEGTLNRLLALHGRNFEYTREARRSNLGIEGVQTGFIAQEVRSVFPEWVEENGDGYLFITERGTTALMVEALRDLRIEKDAQIKQLADQAKGMSDAIAVQTGLIIEMREDISALKTENKELRSRIAALEKIVEGMLGGDAADPEPRD